MYRLKAHRARSKRGGFVQLLFAMVFTLSVLTLSLISGSQYRYTAADRAYQGRIAIRIAEAGAEQVVWQLNRKGASSPAADANFYEHRGFRGGFKTEVSSTPRGYSVVSHSVVRKGSAPPLVQGEVSLELEKRDGHYVISSWKERFRR